MRRLILIAVMVFMGAFLSVASPNFLTIDNLTTLLEDASLYGIIALGLTFVLITAEIDISFGATVAFTAMIAGNFLANTTIPVIVFLPLVFAAGAIVGVVNGFLITRFRLPDFIATLAVRGVLSGLALLIAIRESGYVTNKLITNSDYLWLGGTIGPIYVVTVAFVLVAIGTHVLLKYTSFGTNVYATGANITAARLSGVNTNRTIVGVYALTGLCAAISAIFISARMTTSMPDMGIGQEMSVIAMVVIGGTAFSGGVGNISGTVLGVLFLALVNNGLVKLGLSPLIQPILIGFIIVITVALDTWYGRLTDRVFTDRRRRLSVPGATASTSGGGQ